MSASKPEQVEDLVSSLFKGPAPGNNNNEVVPPIDVVNLTMLLKSIGFQLDFIDFLPGEGANPTKTVSVELNCSVSGMKAKLSHKIAACACPPKRESSFWKVTSHAAAGAIQEASSSLLPKMSENCAIVSKAILANLLSFYRDSMEDRKPSPTNGSDPHGIKRKLKIPAVFDSPQMAKVSKIPTPPKREQPDLVQLMTPPSASPIPEEIPETDAVAPSVEQRSSTASVLAQSSIELTVAKIKSHQPGSVELEDEKMPDLEEVENGPNFDLPCPVSSVPKESKPELSPLGSSLGSIDAKIGSAASPSHDRDSNVITALNLARKQIDQALLYMNFNVTQTLSDDPDRISTTPMSGSLLNLPPSMALQRSSTFASIPSPKAQAVINKPILTRRSSIGVKSSPIYSPAVRSRSSLGAEAISRLKGIPKTTPKATPSTPSASTAANLSALSINSSARSITRKSQRLATNAPSLIERFKMQKKEVTPAKK